MIPSDESLQAAAQCWCDEETKDRVMDVELAKAFAKRLDLEIERRKIAVEILLRIKCAWGCGFPQKDIYSWVLEALELVSE